MKAVTSVLVRAETNIMGNQISTTCYATLRVKQEWLVQLPDRLYNMEVTPKMCLNEKWHMSVSE